MRKIKGKKEKFLVLEKLKHVRGKTRVEPENPTPRVAYIVG